jgi:hypothetical protein
MSMALKADTDKARLDPLTIVNTPATRTEQTADQQQGMLGLSQSPSSSFAEGWSDLNVANSKTLDNMDRIGGLFTQKNQAQTALNTAPEYAVGNGLSFSMHDEIFDDATGKQRVSELNSFTSSPEYVQGLNSFAESMKGSGMSDAEIQMYYANANGVVGRGSNLFFNKDTNKFDYKIDSPDYLKAVIATGLTTALTMGVGTALGGAMGSAIAGKATVAGVASLAQGGSPKDALLSAATAGFGEYAKGIQKAAQAVDATQAVKNTAQTLNTIKKTVNVAQAVASGNTVGAILGGMDLMGLPSVTSMVSDKLTETFPDSEFLTNPDNLEAVSSSLTTFGTKLASGGDPQKALASAMWNYVKSDGALPSLDINLDLGEGWDTPEWMRQIDSEELQPIKDAIVAGYQEVNDKVLNPIQEIGSAASGVVREAGRDVREAVDPYADVVREAGRDVREAVSPYADDVREAGGDLREVASDNSEVIKDGLGALLGALGGLGGLGQQGGQRMAGVMPMDNPLLTIEDAQLTDYETLDNNLLQSLRI